MKERGLVYIGTFCITIVMLVHSPVNAQPTDATPLDPSITVLPLEFPVPTPSPEAYQAAIKGKKTMERLVGNNDKEARELGFNRAVDAADSNTELGTPYSIIRIDFDKLRDYEPTTSPLTLLIPTTEFIYPITVQGEVQSSLTVTGIRRGSPANTVWRTTEWGFAGLIKALDTASKIAQASPSRFHLVIRPLSRFFLGDFSGGRFVIIPLSDEPRLFLKRGNKMPAQDVFAALKSEASSISIMPKRRP